MPGRHSHTLGAVEQTLDESELDDVTAAQPKTRPHDRLVWDARPHGQDYSRELLAPERMRRTTMLTLTSSPVEVVNTMTTPQNDTGQ
jgi:hypothetical protein